MPNCKKVQLRIYSRVTVACEHERDRNDLWLDDIVTELAKKQFINNKEKLKKTELQKKSKKTKKNKKKNNKTQEKDNNNVS